MLIVPEWVEQIKFGVALVGGLWTVFAGYTFLKNELTTTRQGVEDVKSELSNQTSAVVSATHDNTSQLRELRSDIKMVVQAMITPVKPARARARRKK